MLTLTTGLAFAVGMPGPRVPVSSNGGHLVTVSTPIYLVCVVLLCAAWSYLLTGVVHARWPVHLAGMALYSLAFAEPIGSLALVPPLLALGALVLLATWTVGLSHRLVRRDRGLGLVLPGLHFTLALALYAVCYLGSLAAGTQLLFGFAMSIQLASLQFVLVPVVFVTGTDFAEWGEVAGSWLSGVAGGLSDRARWLLPAAASAAALATIADGLREHGFGMLGQVVPFAVATALAAALVAAGRTLARSRPVRIPLGAIALGALGFLVSLLVAYFAVAPNPFGSETLVGGVAVTRYEHPSDPVFSIQQPSLWETSERSSPYPEVTFDGRPVNNSGRFTIVAAPAGALGGDAFAGWVGQSHLGQAGDGGPAGRDGAWTWRGVRLTLVDGTQLSGRAWQREDGGRTWLLYGVSKADVASLNDPLYAGLVRSWRPDVEAAAPESAPSGNAMVAVGAVPWALLLAGLVALLALRPRARAGLATGSLFLGLVATLYVTTQMGAIAELLHLPLRIDGLRETGLQSGLAVITLGILAWHWALGRLAQGSTLFGLLLTLLVSLQVVSWVFALFDLKSTGFGVVQTALIAAALTWDVVMGGGAVARGHGRWFPRQSRVLVYFGYDMLVATAVLFFSALRDQVTGRVADTGFETDFWAQNGLLVLGLPMLVCLFLVKLGRLRGRA